MALLPLLLLIGADEPAAPPRTERAPDFPSRFVKARNADVWLPGGYPQPGSRYAVAYIQDGQNLFNPQQRSRRRGLGSRPYAGRPEFGGAPVHRDRHLKQRPAQRYDSAAWVSRSLSRRGPQRSRLGEAAGTGAAVSAGTVAVAGKL